MCTVSFVAARDSVILTSNRDENIARSAAAAPSFHQLKNKKVIFPRDAKAGGTWFVASDVGEVAVLLNGAFVKHIASPPYRKSRGIILLQIVEADDQLLFFKKLDLDNIEPFTVVLYQPGSLHELRWDGSRKHEKSLATNGNYIWSSSTLYTDDVIKSRRNLFDKFVNSGIEKTDIGIRNFHGDNRGDCENGFVINRQTGMRTFSITQAVITPASISFVHNDLLLDKHYEEIMQIK